MNKEGKRDYCKEAYNNFIRQKDKLKNITFILSNYSDLYVPDKSVVYCDPPYRGTTKYKDSIDYEHFYNWCKTLDKRGCTVFVSEYYMPEPFTCIWSKEVASSLDKDTGSKRNVEKLFKL